jgi:hypothetical protein
MTYVLVNTRLVVAWGQNKHADFVKEKNFISACLFKCRVVITVQA